MSILTTYIESLPPHITQHQTFISMNQQKNVCVNKITRMAWSFFLLPQESVYEKNICCVHVLHLKANNRYFHSEVAKGEVVKRRERSQIVK